MCENLEEKVKILIEENNRLNAILETK